MSLVTPARPRPRAASAWSGPLASCSALGRCRVSEPARQRGLVLLGQRYRVKIGPRSVGGRDGQRGQRAGAASPAAEHGKAGPFSTGPVLVQPLRHLAGPGPGDLHVEACLGPAGRGLLARGRARDAVGQRGVQALAEHPELKRVEKLMDLLPVPGFRPQVQRPGLQRHVPGQLGELPVAQHVGEVLTELVPRLALDLVHPVHELGQRAELRDPLGGGLLPHARDARQVVAGVAAQSRRSPGTARG